MTLEHFRWLFKDRAGVELKDFAVFKQNGRWQLIVQGERTVYKRLEQLAEAVVNGKTVMQHINEFEKIQVRPLSSKGDRPTGPQRKAFDHAGGGSGTSIQDFPSRFNTGDRFQTEEKIADEFRNRYVNSRKEHAITVDERGFVTRHVHGDGTSVGITGRKGEMVYHNHPGAHGGSFSDSDLLSTAMEQSRGIVAVAREGTYTFTKGKKFDAAGFYAAVKKAKVPANLDYDAGVAHWMSKNAKKYDFQYSFTPAKVEAAPVRAKAPKAAPKTILRTADGKRVYSSKQYKIVQVEGQMRQAIGTNGKASKYTTPKVFSGKDASKFIQKNTYKGMSHRYEIIEV